MIIQNIIQSADKGRKLNDVLNIHEMYFVISFLRGS